jgi:hypothetical protein
LPQITDIAEVHFRAQRKLAPDAKRSDAGFTFPQDRFTLSKTYGFTDKALLFFFNECESGSHSMGTKRLEIPYDEIGDLINPVFQ